MTLSAIANVVILTAAFLAGVASILKVVGRPFKFLKKRVDKDFSEKFKENFTCYMEEYNKKIDEKFSELEKSGQENINFICAETTKILNEIKEINEIQSANIEQQSKNIEILSKSSKDVLRQKFMFLYQKGKKAKAFTIYEKESFEELYKDYKLEGGNGYIDKYYQRTLNWAVILEEEEE